MPNARYNTVPRWNLSTQSNLFKENAQIGDGVVGSVWHATWYKGGTLNNEQDPEKMDVAIKKVKPCLDNGMTAEKAHNMFITEFKGDNECHNSGSPIVGNSKV